MKRWMKFAVCAMVWSLATAAVAQGPTEKNSKPSPKNGDTPSEHKAYIAADDPSYVIGPEDVLTINVWKEPEISRTVTVRPDGKISLPLLKDIQAANLTPLQLGQTIAEGLRKFLNDQEVTVIVDNVNSRRVYILGEVNRPGSLTLSPNMTVLQALLSAGGPSQYAKTKKIYVLRSANGEQVRLPFKYKEAVAGSPNQDFVLKPGDTIVVP